ncbi:hypothetical protein ACI3EY_07960 [Ornithinimicrobium sp. LYQ92]|uniref:hypothetical protein n=1 Tax=Serinicoccus sp. LYQ92 TaxID=3378798 RepID=UPI0038551022
MPTAPNDAAPPVSKFTIVFSVAAVLLSGAYWYQIVNGDTDWRTWFLAVLWLTWPVMFFALDRYKRKAIQQQRDSAPN